MEPIHDEDWEGLTLSKQWNEGQGHRPHPRNVPRSPADGSYKPPGGKSKCCAMVEAGRALRRRKYRLAGRYARMGARLIAARVM